MMPRYVGIVTSQTGAAIRDMLRVARRRNPNVGIIVAPCAVQGVEAAGQIVRAIERLNKDGRPDVILCGRGGGSIEDLWAFNEEIVARAIAASQIPVISCVGHETDFTIADFVADVRAATPSMAAEIAVPVTADLHRKLEVAMQRVRAGLTQANRIRRAELNRICASQVFKNPADVLIGERSVMLDGLWERCCAAENEMLRSRRNKLERIESSLRALNPSGVLDRGYAYVSKSKSIVSSAKEIQPKDTLRIQFHDGMVRAQAIESELTEVGLLG